MKAETEETSFVEKINKIADWIMGIKYCENCGIKLTEDTGIIEFKHGKYCKKCGEKERDGRL